MRITLNGEGRELPGPLTLAELLKDLGLDSRLVAVEVNRAILKSVEFDGTALRDGDVLEVVHFVGGG